MDYESSDSRAKGCWDPFPLLGSFLDRWTSATATPEFELDDDWCAAVIGIGYASAESAPVSVEDMKQVYRGDAGRKKVRMAALCLVTRDGLLLRLGDVKCPVFWLQASFSYGDAF